MARRDILARFALFGIAVNAACGGISGPSESLSGTYAFTWESDPGHFIGFAPARSSTGTVTIAAVSSREIRYAFAVPLFDATPQGGGWTGTDWQIGVGIQGLDPQTQVYHVSYLILHWTPGASCRGLVGVAGDQWPGTCTFTRTGP